MTPMIICHRSRHGNEKAMAICTANFKKNTPSLEILAVYFYRLFMVMASYEKNKKPTAGAEGKVKSPGTSQVNFSQPITVRLNRGPIPSVHFCI